LSDELDELAEAARNRGLKLIRSRVRTPTKRRFGKVGLTDKAGKPVFGMDAKGPTAKPEEVQDHLRKLGTKDWGASLDVAAPQRKRKTAKPARKPANDQPEPTRSPPKPRPKPKLLIRDAKAADAARLVALIHELGHEIDENAVRKNLSSLQKAGETPLVATLGKEVVGLCGVHRTITIHRDAPLGRITILVVTQEAQGHGIGRLLVEAAESWMREIGCKLVEVTSNDRRTAAHAFYRHLGYERTSLRFAKAL
jgi:GNAT superfamily N-acetyltransferase